MGKLAINGNSYFDITRGYLLKCWGNVIPTYALVIFKNATFLTTASGAPGPRTHLGGLRDLPRRHHSGHPQRVDRGRDERCYGTGYGGSCGRPVTWCEPLWGMIYSCWFMFIHLYSWIYPRKNPIMIWYDRPKDLLSYHIRKFRGLSYLSMIYHNLDMINQWLLQTLQKNFTELRWVRRFGVWPSTRGLPRFPRKWRVVGLGNGIAFRRRLGPEGIPSALSCGWGMSCSFGIWDELGNLMDDSSKVSLPRLDAQHPYGWQYHVLFTRYAHCILVYAYYPCFQFCWLRCWLCVPAFWTWLLTPPATEYTIVYPGEWEVNSRSLASFPPFSDYDGGFPSHPKYQWFCRVPQLGPS